MSDSEEANQPKAPSRRTRAIAAEATVEVVRKSSGAEGESVQKKIDLPLEVEPGIQHDSTVTVGCGFTKNLQNYESARFYVEVKIPCQSTDEDIRSAGDRGIVLSDMILTEAIRQLLTEPSN